MITTIFFDIGGVLLTDGWGHDSRRAAAVQFGLDWDDFTDRHEKVAHLIETNRLPLERYLDRVIFYRPRSFSRDEFRAFVFAQSQSKPDSLEIAEELANLKKYFLATLRKPDEAIYRAALNIMQRPAEQCLFIDDREVNLECPRELGLRTIHFEDARQLRRELGENGVDW